LPTKPESNSCCPIARWIVYGGETDFHGSVLETLIWATGLLANTKHINVFATVHTAFIHPLVAANNSPRRPT